MLYEPLTNSKHWHIGAKRSIFNIRQNAFLPGLYPRFYWRSFLRFPDTLVAGRGRPFSYPTPTRLLRCLATRRLKAPWFGAGVLPPNIFGLEMPLVSVSVHSELPATARTYFHNFSSLLLLLLVQCLFVNSVINCRCGALYSFCSYKRLLKPLSFSLFTNRVTYRLHYFRRCILEAN